MRKGKLENWQEVQWGRQIRIHGNVYGCDSFQTGEEMITNEVVEYHGVMGSLIVETRSGSMYTLGTPADRERTLEEIFAEFGQEGNDVRGLECN